MGGLLSQCLCIANHHDVHCKYLTVLHNIYTSIKVKKMKDKVTEQCNTVMVVPKLLLTLIQKLKDKIC